MRLPQSQSMTLEREDNVLDRITSLESGRARRPMAISQKNITSSEASETCYFYVALFSGNWKERVDFSTKAEIWQ